MLTQFEYGRLLEHQHDYNHDNLIPNGPVPINLHVRSNVTFSHLGQYNELIRQFSYKP